MRRRVGVVFAASIAGFLVSPPAQGEAPAPLRYVAMGDSFSAASGVLPLDLQADPRCARSTANYANVIAATTGARLTDVTCGAAQTKDFTAEQYPGVAPQLESLTKRTQLVTLTIGGNDNGTFINAIVSCGAAGLSTLGMGSPCKDQYGDSFAKDVREKTYPRVRKVLNQIQARAPRATVAILGYPWLLPKTGGCFHQMPVATGDVPYLRSLQATLNDAVRRAARDAGVVYVNLNKLSQGHDACQPIGVRWVEPALLGTNFVPVHPNALGERKMAEAALAKLALD